MKKWTIHRPTTQPKKESGRPTRSKTTLTPNERKSSSSRWTLHNPANANPPDGHGWHFDGTEARRDKSGKVALGQRWTCDYGCKSFLWENEPEPGQYHAYDCPYWRHEGKDLTPF